MLDVVVVLAYDVDGAHVAFEEYCAAHVIPIGGMISLLGEKGSVWESDDDDEDDDDDDD